jgi:hypothetical protein
MGDFCDHNKVLSDKAKPWDRDVLLEYCFLVLSAGLLRLRRSTIQTGLDKAVRDEFPGLGEGLLLF